MLPQEWEKRLVDMKYDKVRDEDIAWADYAFISAMVVQRASTLHIIERCQAAGVKIVAGGPLFSSDPNSFPQVDHLVLNEAEITLPLFLKDLQAGVYQTHLHLDGICRHHPDARPIMAAGAYQTLRHPGHPVFAWLPIRLRVLQHYRAIRP